MAAEGQDANYLRDEQYKNANNFMARVRLHAEFSTNPYRWTKWVLDQIDAPPDATVLELGSGPGILWKANADRIPSGWQITLSDFSPGMVEEQRRNLQDVPGNFSFEVIDARSIPYEAGTFDVVIANHMLYHVPDRPKALAEIRRVLKPSGKLYAATNGTQHFKELHELARMYGKFRKSQVSDAPFTLENGLDQLAAVFPQVELRRHEDSLVVTEVEPLVAYVLSAWSFRESDSHVSSADFVAFIEREMQTTGAIHITKDAGLFIASNV